MDNFFKKNIPDFYLETPDTEKYLEILQYGLQKMHTDISGLKDVKNYEKAIEQYLDMMLIEEGFIVGITLTLARKRKLIKILRELYSKSGLNSGLILAAQEIMGLTIEIHDMVEDGFELDNNSLGENTILGYAGYFLHLDIHTPVLTADQLADIKKIVDAFRWALTTYTIKQVL